MTQIDHASPELCIGTRADLAGLSLKDAKTALLPQGCRVSHKPDSEAIRELTEIWKRALQRPCIGIEDNFFELGGDPWAASNVFTELARVCGRELPLEMIYEAPTIAALAAVLEQPSTPRCPPLALLRPGSEQPPIFIAHGMGGSVTEFFELVRHVQTRHSIYGLQSKGTDGVDEPFERIEDMAEFYLNAIEELQPRGPYILIGYSLGGLVALEMAQRLLEKGEKLALLAMLDAYPHRRFLSPEQRVRLFVRLAKWQATNVLRLPARDALHYVTRPSERRSYRSRHGRGSATCRSQIGPSIARAMQRVSDAAYLALTSYRPRFYKGEIRFVKAAISSEFPSDPGRVWTNLAEKFEIETVPGDHHGILTTHFETLAGVITRYLEEADSQG
jgi:thioesterase domain-containing protein